MAVISSEKESRLRLILQTGTDKEGNPTYKTKSYSDVKTDATDENVYAVADVLSGLQQHTLFDVERVNTLDLDEE